MEQATDTHGLKIALAVGVILVILQLTAYFLTNIVSQLAAAFDSLSDVIISSFLWISVYLSRKPADELHMFGHGRAQNVAALNFRFNADFLAQFRGIPKCYSQVF